MDIHTPTPIQARTLAPLLAGRDVIGQARTGSGKTLAFGIPLVERVRAGNGGAQALILVPTRELASQVGSVIALLGKGHRLRVVELVGGRGFDPQAHALRNGGEIIVGTPGRVMDHLKQRTLRLDRLSYLVLDEADEMLDQGFGPDVDRIIGFIPAGTAAQRQNALFSATLPEWARTVAARLLKNPVEVRVDDGRPASVSPESVESIVYDVPEGGKPSVLRALLNQDQAAGSATLVFGRTRHGVKKLAKQLVVEGYNAGALQSDLSQNQRDRVIQQFRQGDVTILVATNVAARGLDIADLGRVINYDLPENGSLFTHRVGRTGRTGRAGEAITLLAPEDAAKWKQLEKEFKNAGLAAAFPRRRWDGPLPPVSEAALRNQPLPQSQSPQRGRSGQSGASRESQPRSAQPATRYDASSMRQPATRQTRKRRSGRSSPPAPLRHRFRTASNPPAVPGPPAAVVPRRPAPPTPPAPPPPAKRGYFTPLAITSAA